MIFVSVVLEDQPPRDVYVDYGYDEPWGKTGGTVLVPPGTHVFETLTADRKIDNRGRIQDATADMTIHLEPVVPPEAI